MTLRSVIYAILTIIFAVGFVVLMAQAGEIAIQCFVGNVTYCELVDIGWEV